MQKTISKSLHFHSPLHPPESSSALHFVPKWRRVYKISTWSVLRFYGSTWCRIARRRVKTFNKKYRNRNLFTCLEYWILDGACVHRSCMLHFPQLISMASALVYCCCLSTDKEEIMNRRGYYNDAYIIWNLHLWVTQRWCNWRTERALDRVFPARNFLLSTCCSPLRHISYF